MRLFQLLLGDKAKRLTLLEGERVTLKLLGPDVAIGLASCLCVVFLMVLLADPEGRGGEEQGIDRIPFAAQ